VGAYAIMHPLWSRSTPYGLTVGSMLGVAGGGGGITTIGLGGTGVAAGSGVTAPAGACVPGATSIVGVAKTVGG